MKPYMTMTEFKAFNREKGQYYFSRETMKFFNSRVHGEMMPGGYFITSERYDDSRPRRYTIRRADFETGNVSTVGQFQEYATLEDARQAVRLTLV